MEAFGREDLETCDPPNVSVNAHSGDPHYEPSAPTSAPIKRRRLRAARHLGEDATQPDSVYYDITWTGSVGTPSDKQREIFDIVRGARDVGINTVKQAFDAKRKIRGWEVDKAVREFIDRQGLRASTSSIAPATPSAATFTVTARILIIWRPRTIARSCPTPASRSSRASTCPSSACAARST